MGRKSFDAFLETIENKSYKDVILMADSEATAVERRLLKTRANVKNDDPATYAFFLKELIVFMRHGRKPRGLHPDQLHRLLDLRNRVMDKPAIALIKN
jgi:hypothetical protein